ncbi:MAG: RICIN domain-containing protein [Bauldia sp.]
MTTAVVRGRIQVTAWSTIASTVLAILTFFTAISSASAQGMQLQQMPLTPDVLRPAEQSRLVTFQGGGLMFLDATAPDKYNLGLNTVIAQYSGAQSQQWLITPQGGGIYTIQQRSSGLFLDAHEVSSEAFWSVLRPRQTFDQTQLWRITEYGGGFVTIQQVSSGRFLQAVIGGPAMFQVVTGLPGNQQQEWRMGTP